MGGRPDKDVRSKVLLDVLSRTIYPEQSIYAAITLKTAEERVTYAFAIPQAV